MMSLFSVAIRMNYELIAVIILVMLAICCAAICKRTDERLHKIDATMDTYAKWYLSKDAHKKAVCLFISIRSTCTFPLRGRSRQRGASLAHSLAVNQHVHLNI
jgi:hypothetical protein